MQRSFLPFCAPANPLTSPLCWLIGRTSTKKPILIYGFYLNATDTSVYLTVAIKKQLARTAHRKGVRPLIDTPDPEAKLRQLNRAREPLYRSTADIIIDTNKKTTQAVAKTILATIENGH